MGALLDVFSVAWARQECCLEAPSGVPRHADTSRDFQIAVSSRPTSCHKTEWSGRIHEEPPAQWARRHTSCFLNLHQGVLYPETRPTQSVPSVGEQHPRTKLALRP